MYSSSFIHLYEETTVIGIRHIFYVDRMVCVYTECTEAGNRSVCLNCFTPRVYYL